MFETSRVFTRPMFLLAAILAVAASGCAGSREITGEAAAVTQPPVEEHLVVEEPQPPLPPPPLPPTVLPAEPTEFAGHWEGDITLPGVEMTFMVDFKYENGTWSGTMDIPMQGAKDLSLSDVKIEGTGIEFALRVPGNPIWRGTLAEGRIEGELTQSGMTFPFYLGREEVEKLARPQEPEPPYPYIEEEVTYNNGDIALAGSLTLPSSGGPFAAVLLITGSGAQNRDEELLGHKPFLLIADFLTRSGIAVLRVDDRGVGGSSPGHPGATSADFVQDVLSGVSFLKGHSEIDPGRIGLLGHSEGGVIAPMAAAESEDVAFVIMLAGTGVPGDEIILEQTRLITRAAGATEEQLQDQWKAQRNVVDLIKAGADSLMVREAVSVLVNIQMARLSESDREMVTDEVIESQITLGTVQGLSEWFCFFLNLDPRTALRKVKVPVLALNGELDLQVPPYQNLPEIEKALKEAGNTDVTIREFPGLNHLFQTAIKTGSPDEYVIIEETMSPDVLETIRDWILARFGG